MDRRRLISSLEGVAGDLRRASQALEGLLRDLSTEKLTEAQKGEPRQVSIRQNKTGAVRRQMTALLATSTLEQKVLEATHALQGVALQKAHETLVSALAGYSPDDSAFRKSIEALSERRLLIQKGQFLHITPEGRPLVDGTHVTVTCAALASYVARRLPKVAGSIFMFLYEKNGVAATTTEVASACARTTADRDWKRSISMLNKRGLIEMAAGHRLACAEILYIDR